MFEQRARADRAESVLTPNNLRLNFLPSIPSVFELPQCSPPRRKVCIYSHPAYWRGMLEENLVSQAGRATTHQYGAQNGKIVKYFDRLVHGEKYLAHEANFERLVKVAALTGVDLIFSIPCSALSSLSSGGSGKTPPKFLSHLEAYLRKVLICDQPRIEPSLRTFMNIGRVYFYPSNETDGRLCKSLMKLPGFESAHASLVKYLSDRVIIPSGGCANLCLKDMLNTLKIQRGRLQVFEETIYTDRLESRGIPSDEECGTNSSELFVPIKGGLPRRAAIAKLVGNQGR